jgi:nitroreductase
VWATALLAIVKAGDHILITDSVYRPTRLFADTILKKLGALARTGAHVAQAAAAVVVAVDKTPFAVSDASRAIQSMLLTAWADGVGSNWVGFGGLEEVKTLLGIPSKLDILAILPLGYPVGAVGRGKKDRKPIGAIAHREQYGQPFE